MTVEAVLVINRYDWGNEDRRAKDEIALGDETNDDATQIRDKKSHERDTSSGGVWIHIPDTKYIFDRFGFDEARKAARSFIFFTMYTYSTRTTFVGLDRTLRVEETDEERFQRYLREGRNFKGLDALERQITWCDWSSHLPAESECLGHCDSHGHLLQSTDLDAIRIRQGVKANEFADPWKELCYACLNEMIMSYLKHFIVPASSCDIVVAAATSLFPQTFR
ncbi:hypothetical protein K469DRAFT_809538 [Zopfia rhizophila CBS 207.26]|uniref:Uncharacterized protein n=1 Tax=Zopfia rhizophila CBS 207.26 TaxID=1314779 RepID=A0A6A6DGG5_9PEZI|nr:hypothetical protein K469DRAFT_809538 [Zopfia rhizophila CBS 207.26]